MINQVHNGSGDNITGNKYEYIIRSVQAGHLQTVIDNIMRDICYRDLDRAREKLNIISKISSLDNDVHLLLNALNVKLELAEGSLPSSKNDLLKLRKHNNLPNDVREVVTSILIDLESRTSKELAREMYSNSKDGGFYIKEVFFERLASKEELSKSYNNSVRYELSEQEVTGLIRGAIRVQDFSFAFELSQFLDESFSSSNSRSLLLHTESCLLVTQNKSNQHISFSKNEKAKLDRLIEQLLGDIGDKNNNRNIHIFTLINLLNLTRFLDSRLNDLGKLHIDKIRKIHSEFAEFIEGYSTGLKASKIKFEFVSDTLDLEQFSHLDFALGNNQINVRDVKKWVDKGGRVHAGDDYVNSFFELYLKALICSLDDKRAVQLLHKKAQSFLELDSEKFTRLNPYNISRLCEKFIELNLPLNAVDYLSPFLSDEAWVSPLFECYLNALFASEKFDLFLSKIKHLELKEKTELIYLREAQVYERLGEYELSIKSTRSAIDISPNNPYAWHLLLHASRSKGLSIDELKNIIFEIPDAIFSTYDESKVGLINEIATYIDTNLAERVLVDWFVENPVKVAKPLMQIHTNALINRPEANSNPYIPMNCGDGVTYSDGFETFTRILTRNIETNHPCLLDIESPLGKTLENMREGDNSGDITMLQRLSPYVAVCRLAMELRSQGNDGTDAFRLFFLPNNEDEFFPCFENILKRYFSEEKKMDKVLQNPHLPLVMKAKRTNPANPIQGAIIHLTSNTSTRYMGLFNRGEETPSKVIIDIYTAVYFSLMGFVSALVSLNIELIVCQHTKKVLEAWIDNILREDYMSLGMSNEGLYRITSEDIQRKHLGFIQGLQILIKHVKLETLKPVDTPELLVKIRDAVDETVYSTLQLSVANNIPLLCIDHLMCELAYHSGCPVVNMNSVIEKILNSLKLKRRKESIQLHLFSGTPVPIFYSDILELSRSSESSDTCLVFKFIEKYGETINVIEYPLIFLTEIVKNVMITAYIDGTILTGGRACNPRYDGYAEYVFNYCCRSAMVTLEGETAEQRLALLIYNVMDIPSQTRKYIELILSLASEFAVGHFLDSNALIASIHACHDVRQLKGKRDIEAKLGGNSN